MSPSFFLNTLGWWQWLILAAVPPAILALYFLKLRRQPLEVPSTYLWRRTIEDLHVNSFWQRLRRNLLLFLQLLLVGLFMLALLRPGWRGEKLTGKRFIFLVDVSASMSATDVEPTRLDEAKRRVGEMIDALEDGDAAMLISFADFARVEQQFTDSRRQLRAALAALQATQRTSDLGEALRAAAGLANPGSTGEKGTSDTQVAEAKPATAYIFSDGGFARVPEFSSGNLGLVYVPLGATTSDNVGIVAFKAEVQPERRNRTSLFGRLENCGPAEVTAQVELSHNGLFVAQSEVVLPPGEGKGVQFDLGNITSGVLELRLQRDDALALDNRAFATVNEPHPAKVLLVTPLVNSALDLAMHTEEAAKLAEVTLAQPRHLASDEFKAQAAGGVFDLMIFDQCQPPEMPQCHTVFFGALPPTENWRIGERQNQPQVLDVDRAHPIMQYLALEHLKIYAGSPIQPPAGGAVLVDSDLTAPQPGEGEPPRRAGWGLAAIAPRGSFEDLVFGFEIATPGENGGMLHNTDWPIRLSFPLFVNNLLGYFGGARGNALAASVQPGRPIVLRATQRVERVVVEAPQGATSEVLRQGENAFVFADTAEVGVYNVREGSATTPTQQFAVNLFDARESDIRVRQEIYPGYEVIAAQSVWTPARRELWKVLLLLALGVLLFEWYVYNRRVYL